MHSDPPPPYSEKRFENYQGSPPPPPILQQPTYGLYPVLIPSAYPMPCTCPNCRQQIITRTEKQNGLLTWIVVGILLLMGCWCGCCLIPLCVDECKDTVHFCPYCSQMLAVNKIL